MTLLKSNKGTDEYTQYLNSELDKGKVWFDNAKKEKIAKFFTKPIDEIFEKLAYVSLTINKLFNFVKE